MLSMWSTNYSQSGQHVRCLYSHTSRHYSRHSQTSCHLLLSLLWEVISQINIVLFWRHFSMYFLHNRYLNPPNFWVVCSLESRELMALCLKRLKNLSKVKLIDANFVWTEPHSKRLKVNFRILSSGTSERMMNKSILRPDPFSKNG